ncbi:MAG: rhodanese-like domain-containing protein [Deltaproteobacteria bacterium]|nr:rhodanese-like domain-containing protein [Deltaproteobacteria bacterium]
MRIVKLIAGAISGALAAACATGAAPVETVSAKIQAGALIVDVRSPGEYADGHYDGAINIPVDELDARLAELGPKDRAVVVYCRSGHRSAKAKARLDAAGFTDVTDGGWLGRMPPRAK